MKHWQITVGFEEGVSIVQLAKILEEHFGETVVGRGVASNGLPAGTVYVKNKKEGKGGKRAG
jgi:hypothetical protein